MGLRKYSENKYRKSSSPAKPNQFRSTPGEGQYVNSEYLRKNIKMTCPDDTHLLDFYTKLRLTARNGGVFLKSIEHVQLEEDIAEPNIPGESPRDIQTNALHVLLSNEDIIPHDYTR